MYIYVKNLETVKMKELQIRRQINKKNSAALPAGQ